MTNGTYISALNAVNQANNLPEVRKFNWTAYYTSVNAEYSSNWKLTYFDVLNSSYGRSKPDGYYLNQLIIINLIKDKKAFKLMINTD